MPSNTIGVAGQGTSDSKRGRAERTTGRATARAVAARMLFAAVLPAVAWSIMGGARVASADEPSPPPVELFAAIERGDVEARVIVRDQYHARVLLRNKTDAPLRLQLPDQFAARPVLAQQNFPFPSTSQSNQPQPQAVSGPFGSQSGSSGFGANQGQQNQNFFGQGNNVFNIAPESVRSVPVKCFCVEMGKSNPRTIHPYELVKFEQVGGDPTLAAVFDRYARGDLDREAVQAAVWHVVNDKSWDELRRLSRRIALNADAPIFSEGQLRLARDLVNYAGSRAGEQPKGETRRVAETPAGVPAVDVGRAIPSSADKYRTIRGINARR